MNNKKLYVIILVMFFGLLWLFIQKSFMDVGLKVSQKNTHMQQMENQKSKVKIMTLDYAQTEGIKPEEVKNYLKNKSDLTPEEKFLLSEIQKGEVTR